MYYSKNKIKPQQGDIGALNMFYGASPVLFEFAKYKRQHPIKYFIADFYRHKAKLIIEVDGGYHNEPEQYQYDRNRDEELIDLGLIILHFTNEQILCNIESVIDLVNENLIPPSPLPSLGDWGVK